MARLALKDIRRGDPISGIYLVEGANFKQSRNGKPFIQMTLRDASAAVKALRWEANRQEFREIEKNPFLHVTGRVEEFQGAPQVIIDELDALSAEAAKVDPTDFLPASRYSLDEMERALHGLIAEIEDDGVRELVGRVLERPIVAHGLRRAPAGKSMHHGWVGGLLEHTLSLARIAKGIAAHYPWVDESLLIAGVVLHDIGKVEELAYDVGFSYTDNGQLVGHITIAVGWIEEAAREVKGLDPEKLMHLKHLVTSHHGKLEFGSPRVPMSAEAIILHFIDNIDARIAGYLEAFETSGGSKKEASWSDYHPMFASRLFFPADLGERVQKAEEQSTEAGPGTTTSTPPGELPFGN